MKLTSKIKSTFSNETLETLAKLCDTMRIPSVIKKMELVQRIIKRDNPDLSFSILGGATNRLVLFINGMPFKFALDSQGWKDNMQEYALGPELQPYVPKPFETNGYILVCEPWRAFTLDEFQLRKMEVIKVLDILAQDYLLGDVGYLKKNYTNWGVDDKGNVGILDYAYVHRATENLFTCEVCGQGILRYDSSYSVLKCSNATVCNAKYTYLERKMVQGDKVDLDMIDEMKKDSLVLKGTRDTIEVTNNDGQLVKGNKKIIKTREQYLQYLKEEQNMSNFDEVSALDLLIDQVNAKNKEEREKIDTKFNELIKESEEEKYEEDDVEVVIDYNPDEEEEDDYDEEDYNEYEESDIDYVVPLSDLIDEISKPLSVPIGEAMPECIVGGKDNKVSLESENIGVTSGDGEYPDGVTIEPSKEEVDEDVDKMATRVADAIENSFNDDKETPESSINNYNETSNGITEDAIDITPDVISTLNNLKGKLHDNMTDEEAEAVIGNAVGDVLLAIDKKINESKDNTSEDFKGVTVNGVPVKELD